MIRNFLAIDTLIDEQIAQVTELLLEIYSNH